MGRDMDIGRGISEWDRTRSLISTLTTTVQAGSDAVRDVVENIWGEITDIQEWTWELVDQIVVGLQAIEDGNAARNVTISNNLTTLYEFALIASSLRTTQSTELLAELKRITLKSETLDEALEELKKIRLGTGLLIGTDLNEEEVE